MNIDEPRHPKFRGMRSSEVLRKYKKEFLNKFKILEEKGIASWIGVFGSIVRDEDTPRSDIDLMIRVPEASPKNYAIIKDILADWICFPVHILLDDGSYLPIIIRQEVIPLLDWN